MNTYSIYNTSSGLFTGVAIRCNTEHLDINVPDGCSCLLGSYDHLSQKVDVATGEVIAYQPPQPSNNHRWDANTKRWVYVKTDDDVAVEVRSQRDSLLTQTDWVVIKSQEGGEPLSHEWKTYRKALRDITSQKGFPRSVEWPVKPS
jgi:hypothetical protein